MKQFHAPDMSVIHLTKEDVVRTSICMGVMCPVFDCPDCIDCPGTFRCLGLTCDYYGG